MKFVYLGINEFHGRIYLQKHSYLSYNKVQNQNEDRTVYFSDIKFGRIGNHDFQFSFKDMVINDLTKWEINRFFIDSFMNQDEWKTIIELFDNAYAFQKTSKIYYEPDPRKYENIIDSLNHSSVQALNEIWRLLELWESKYLKKRISESSQ